MQTELENIAHMYGDQHISSIKKQRRKRQKLLANELLVDYAKNSTMHGFRYIVEQGLSTIEKVFWLTCLVASFIICSYYIYNVCQKWITSPVIVAVNEKLSSVETVPFPAITICPQITVKATVYNFTEEQKKYDQMRSSESEDIKYIHISTMCFQNYLGFGKRYFENVSLVTDITEVALTLDDIFSFCSLYNDNTADCEDIFSKVYTEEGVCYTANTLAATEIFEDSTQQEYPYLESDISSKGWSINTGYDHNIIRYPLSKYYPRRGRFLGATPVIRMYLNNIVIHRDTSCNELYSGYKIYLHHPADIPQSSVYYTALPGDEISLAISFNEFSTDPNLSRYSPDKRQCYFAKERKLRYFKIYTMKNCQAECLTNYTLDLCNCVGFYMPHNDSTELCGSSKFSCKYRAKETMALGEIDAEIRIKRGVKEACHCLPACDAIEYDAEMSKIDVNFNNKKSTYVSFYFKKPQFMTMQRRELFGVTDLLANIGGLLGLFLGFSFLSFIEIIYFVTLRIGFTLKRKSEEEKAMESSSSKKY